MSTPSRMIALISYLLPIAGPLGALAARRDDPAVRYHSAQALAIDAASIGAPLGWAALGWALAWIPTAGSLLGVISFGLVLAFEILMFVSRLLGAARALRGDMHPVPVVGGWAERVVLPPEPAPAAADPSPEQSAEASGPKTAA